jgi:hypothetical protein
LFLQLLQILYGVDSVGLDGEVKKFEKPIFQTWLMFLAMVFALPIHWAYHYHVERQWRRNNRNGSTCNKRVATFCHLLPLTNLPLFSNCHLPQ